MYKTAFLLFLVFFLVIIQTSFFAHFALLRYAPNLALVFAILWNFFERNKNLFSPGLLVSLCAGFMLDVYSDGYFGFFLSILLIATIFIKKFLRSYVRVPFVKES